MYDEFLIHNFFFLNSIPPISTPPKWQNENFVFESWKKAFIGPLVIVYDSDSSSYF